MTDTVPAEPIRVTRLLVDFIAADLDDEAAEWLLGADGLVGDRNAFSAAADAAVAAGTERITRGLDLATLAEAPTAAGLCCVVDGGLDAALRSRDALPDLDWVPRLEVDRPETRYSFRRADSGAGFSMYMPDTGAIQGFRTADAARQPLEAWLAQAVDAGFRTVWLHGCDAAAAGRGADIELLERARRHFAGGRIWLSGGIMEPRHLETLAREGGAKAAVVPASVARRWGCETLAAALELDAASPPQMVSLAPSERCAPPRGHR